jgi:hypothetical protein
MICPPNLGISSNVANRDRLMLFISTPVRLVAKGRMLEFLLLAFALLEATAGSAVAQPPDANAALRQRLNMQMIQQLNMQMIQQQQQNLQLIQLQLNAVPQPPVERFYRMIFQPDQDPDAARQRLETSLSYEVAEIDRTCTLSPAQKHKLLLIGRGDIKRFFDRCEALKRKYVAVENDDQNRGEMNEDISSLQMTLQSGLFQGNSLLHKALPRALTGEQFAQYDGLMRDRLQSRHLAAIERVVVLLEKGSPFTEAERQNFRAFLKKEIRPSRLTSPYDLYDVFGQLGRLPEVKVKPFLNDVRRIRLNQYENTYQRVEFILRKAGYFRDEDDEDEKPDAAAMAPEK